MSTRLQSSVFKFVFTFFVAPTLWISLACSHAGVAPASTEAANHVTYADKASLVKVRPAMDHSAGLIQLTGKDLVVGQKVFPKRTPADPSPYVDPATGEVYIYGTQVDGTGFSYLKFPNKQDMLRGVQGELIAKEVYLPNGKIMKGVEAIWDTYRLPYSVLQQAFSKSDLEKSYVDLRIPAGSDLFYGGIALQDNGSLGRWIADNWRRRIRVMAPIDGRLQILAEPVFNPLRKGLRKEDYIGHAYGPNFKLVRTAEGKTELWMISEEITRRVNETGKPAEVTEIVARKMISPFQASDSSKVLLVSVNDKNGKPHRDSDRGEKMGHSKLIEGFRPTSVNPEGVRIAQKAVTVDGVMQLKPIPAAEQKEYFYLTGSPGNFAGDDYDAIVAVREGGAIGKYEILTTKDGLRWKRFLAGIKKVYNLSWAGRGAFFQDDNQDWWLLFHAVDKDLKPDGSYSGVIPTNTYEYHRNLYAVPVEFYINEEGKPDMFIR